MLVFSPNVADAPGQALMEWTQSTNTDYYLRELNAVLLEVSPQSRVTSFRGGAFNVQIV